ncbi:malonate decarboxylase holo-ACP synthase [Burkholderia sp. WAC0059]|uniref:malonate decarboxylase holo-ACP synthase n=1 Tax=Burkholderia sp. WAC0059 TaxID=2066022 RepID=UPI000C7F4545|nr:malonate decarboxylase holo-ACP synthase [Burkholderia sp. WAC0059]PLZ02123.1 malonate decarboxylase holo-ACP synthase [Burkholderia sp. WAC0059]
MRDEDDTPAIVNARWRAHDLLRARRLPAVDGEAPAWLRDAFARAPFAVVRRARAAPGRVAVGLRGTTRAERLAAWLDADDVEAAYSPEDLVALAPLADRAALPAFAALAALRDAPASPLHAFAWGPTGSAGFELAARTPAVQASSDLDLLIRMPRRCDPDTARALLDALDRAARTAHVRIDAQLETPAGGVALAELAADKPRVLVRGADGPYLSADPWRAP